ncbi:hypothetical protein [Effusibacillus lacus]|uniref:Uncharacterized protein n=1 Tax=Effusibacillus lacus TaxID=1348429 RepID=A0A292YKI9_9BACL|nr:hypothetical protein [Effusibacillus lacus]TCS75526.1 hypothetical protein EDD64_10783 [Effusibacillus lacus]GAX88990.1 hypothetical protein EFBL_0604 [Effusibacillus lacus]
MESEQERLVQMLMQRTGQPREKVEEWVAGMVKMFEGSMTVYDLSHMAKDFVVKHAKEAKPFLFRFGRSLLESYLEEQRRLQELQLKQREAHRIIPQRARSGGSGSITRTKIKSVRKTAAKEGTVRPARYNPWASEQVLRKEPIYIIAYKYRSTR